jgi:hypothetical protein
MKINQPNLKHEIIPSECMYVDIYNRFGVRTRHSAAKRKVAPVLTSTRRSKRKRTHYKEPSEDELELPDAAEEATDGNESKEESTKPLVSSLVQKKCLINFRYQEGKRSERRGVSMDILLNGRHGSLTFVQLLQKDLIIHKLETK